jgi:hypothetical protein
MTVSEDRTICGDTTMVPLQVKVTSPPPINAWARVPGPPSYCVQSVTVPAACTNEGDPRLRTRAADKTITTVVAKVVSFFMICPPQKHLFTVPRHSYFTTSCCWFDYFFSFLSIDVAV